MARRDQAGAVELRVGVAEVGGLADGLAGGLVVLQDTLAAKGHQADPVQGLGAALVRRRGVEEPRLLGIRLHPDSELHHAAEVEGAVGAARRVGVVEGFQGGLVVFRLEGGEPVLERVARGGRCGGGRGRRSGCRRRWAGGLGRPGRGRNGALGGGGGGESGEKRRRQGEAPRPGAREAGMDHREKSFLVTGA